MKTLILLTALCACFLNTKGQSKKDSIQMEKYSEKALKYYYTHPDSNKIYIDSLFLLEKTTGLKTAKAKALRMKGIYFHLKSENDSALKYYREATFFARDIGDDNLSAESQLNLGMVFINKGIFDSSLYHSKAALAIFEKEKNNRLIGRAIGEIAKVYSLTGDHDKALPYFKMALKNAKANGTVKDLSNAFNHMCTVYNYLKEYDSSIYYAHKAIPLFEEVGDVGGLGSTYQNLGNIYKDLDLIDSSAFYFQKSLTILKQWDYAKGLGETYYNLGMLFKKKMDQNQAIFYLKTGLEYSMKANDFHLVSLQSKELSVLYAEKKDFEKALEYQLNHQVFNDSILSISKQQMVSELQTQYETEKKEQQIVLQNAQLSEQEAELQRNQILLGAAVLALILLITLGLLQRNRLKKKQQLKLQEAELRARELEINATISSQEKERARYARDLHDGFGQMISVLNMNLKNLEDGAKPDERHKVFENSSKVIDEMYGELKNICFDLMPQTLIKHGLESALNELAGRINQAEKIFIELNIFGLDQRLTEIQEISLYRISQEWVNNILKYSDANKITLQITKDEDEITLLIEDNGTGFDKSLLEQGKGNGWKNLNTRAKLIKGELELETEAGVKGNTLIIDAPTSMIHIGNTAVLKQN
jgi:signal transduction histidine kinase